MVWDALSRLKAHKSDGSRLSSNCFIHAAPVIADLLAELFQAIGTAIIMPPLIRDCIFVPIPKGNKDPTVSDSYRSIALASSLSKVLETTILLHFSEFFVTSDLLFGYKKRVSTSLCTGFIKNVVNCYVQSLWLLS